MQIPIADILRRAAKFTTDNSPAILTGIAVAGTLATAWWTHKATAKATREWDAHEYVVTDAYEKGDLSQKDYDAALSRKEQLKLVGKYYLAPLLMGGVTIGAIVSAHRIGANRAAAITTAYLVSARAWEEAEEKFTAKLGDKKTREVREEIAQARVDRSPFPSGQNIFLSGTKSWILDHYSGRYFQSDYESLRAAQNTLNEQILHDDTATLTDFYDLIGLERNQVSDEIGWNTDRPLRLDLDNAALTPADSVYPPPKVPCVVMAYKVEPVRQYRTNFRPV